MTCVHIIHIWSTVICTRCYQSAFSTRTAHCKENDGCSGSLAPFLLPPFISQPLNSSYTNRHLTRFCCNGFEIGTRDFRAQISCGAYSACALPQPVTSIVTSQCRRDLTSCHGDEMNVRDSCVCTWSHIR